MESDAEATDPVVRWRARLADVRYRGYGGGRIRAHRAIFQVPLQRRDIAVAVLLPTAVLAAQLLVLQAGLGIWAGILDFWNRHLALGGTMATRIFPLGAVSLRMPQLDVGAGPPDADTWWWTLLACGMLFLATYRIPRDRFLPATYIIRACLLVQATALAFFYWNPMRFPYDLQTYLSSNLLAGLALLFLIPWLLGCTYFIFNFPLWQKAGMTLLILAFFFASIPLQFLVHAYLLVHLSLLFLPLLHVAFGMFLDILLLIAFYSWAMSLRANE